MNRRIVYRLSFVATLLLGVVCLGSDAADTQKIDITASRFSFSPSEITVKKGQKVTLEIQSSDVNHGLVIKDLGVRTEVRKGSTVEVSFVPDQVGTHEGKCAHFCGSGHGSMKFTVHVVE